ncbi:MAG: MoxR-like ATPase [Gammaproteobacteria bacterium]
MNETGPERTTLDHLMKLIERAGSVSPRADINIVHAARINAALQGNDFVTPNDIVEVIAPILRHKIIFKSGEIEQEEHENYLNKIMKKVL